MARILVVEDTPEIQKIIKYTLGSQHNLTIADTISKAESKLEKDIFDIILLDVVLPDGNGFYFCSKVKNGENNNKTPIIFLSSKSKTDDKVMGLSLGAEDYITKPFEPAELKARVQARLRSVEKKDKPTDYLIKDDLKIHLTHQKVYLTQDKKDNYVDLTPLEYKLLLYFIKNQDRVFSRDLLIEKVWDNDLTISDRTVDTHVSNLRKKLSSSSFSISSIYGIGYRFTKRTQN